MLARIWREPTLHFFAIAALALSAQRLIAGDPRTIEITPALRADLLRRYHDQLNRPPTEAEAEAFMRAWKRDEALYREALNEGIERDDPAVRTLLIGKMRDRLLLQTRLREPTEAELQQFLERHRDELEAPLLYEHEFVTLPKSQATTAQQRKAYLEKLATGAKPSELGLRSTAANVDRQRIEQDLGPGLADRIRDLPLGQWRELETTDSWLLVRLIRVQGGLPDPETLRAQLLGGFKAELAQKALLQASEAVEQRYRFEEKRR